RPQDTLPSCGRERSRISFAARIASILSSGSSGSKKPLQRSLSSARPEAILNGALLRAGLVDEVDVQVLPFVLGSESAPALFEGYNPGLALPPCRMRLLGAEPRPDGSVLLRYAPDPLPFSESRNSSGPS